MIKWTNIAMLIDINATNYFMTPDCTKSLELGGARDCNSGAIQFWARHLSDDKHGKEHVL